MKKGLFTLLVILTACVCLVSMSQAYTLVPSYGETGWKSVAYSVGEVGGQGGTIKFSVYDAIDTSLNSQLLIDNVKVYCNFGGYFDHGQDSFESGIWTGTGYGNAAQAVSTMSYNGTTYYPTDGSNMALLTAKYDMTSPTDMFEFHGSGLGYDPTVVSFDWNFLAFDYTPFNDYSFATITFADGSTATIELGMVQPIQPIPEPATMLLLGSGLIGLAGYARKRFKK